MDEPEWAAPGVGAAAPSPVPAPAAEGADRPVARTAPVRLPVPLRPMTLPDLLDGSFAVIKARPRTVFAIAAAVLVPLHLVAAFLQRGLTGFSFSTGLSQQGTTTASTANQVGAVLAGYAGVALLALAPFFLGAALGLVVTAWYAGQEVTAGQALRGAWHRAPALIAVYLLLLPLKVVGIMFCLIGALPVVTVFVVTAPALAVERLGPVAAAQRSFRLVSRRFWWCLLTVVIATVGAYVLTSIFATVPQVLTSLLPAPLDWLARGLVEALVSMVVTTALVAVAVLLYIDLRIRTEGLDLELAAADAFTTHG